MGLGSMEGVLGSVDALLRGRGYHTPMLIRIPPALPGIWARVASIDETAADPAELERLVLETVALLGDAPPAGGVC